MCSFQLLTPRLRLRPFFPEDATGFFHMNAQPEVIRYTGDVPFGSIEEAARFIGAYDAYQKYGYGRWTILRRSDAQYLGFCGLKFHPETEETDLGYRLDRRFWGNGYATEAAQVCITYAFTSLKLPFLVGNVHPANEPSKRVLRRLGFVPDQQIHSEGWERWCLLP